MCEAPGAVPAQNLSPPFLFFFFFFSDTEPNMIAQAGLKLKANLLLLLDAGMTDKGELA